MNIGIDFDNVMNNLLDTWCDKLNELVPKEKKRNAKDIVEWSMTSSYPTLDVSDIFGVLRESEFWNKVRPKDGAVENIKKLMKDNHTIYIVTAAPIDTIYPKYEYCIKKHFPFIPRNNIICIDNKALLNLDVLIDDYPSNLKYSPAYCILFKHPYNVYAWNKYFSTNSWEDIYCKIKELNS